VYLDAIFVGVRDGAHVKKRAFYVALGMGLDGKRDVLGLWVAESEGAKFWLEIFTELKNRGVNDILFRNPSARDVRTRPFRWVRLSGCALRLSVRRPEA
jgi:transposase-like protein